MNVSAEALALLAQNAQAFGRTYAALKEALIREGVPPDEARQEARNAATIAAVSHPDDGETCPLCGK